MKTNYCQKKENDPLLKGVDKISLPVVYITPEARQRLDLYIQVANGEISGLGTVTRLGNDFLITAVHLFEQESTGASTDLSSEDVSKFLLEAVRAELEPSQLKLWWHSHATMDVFWSETDKNTSNNFSNGWMLSVVGNKEGKYLCRLDLYEPIRLTLNELKFEVRQEADPVLEAAIKDEVAKKVKTKSVYTYPYLGVTGKGFGPYGSPLCHSSWPWKGEKGEEVTSW